MQLTSVTPVIEKGPPVTGAGLIVSMKLVLTLRLPGSVAFTVTLDTPDTKGVPLMVLPDRLKPAGKPLAVKVSASPLGSEKEEATFRLKLTPTVPVWLAMPVVVGAWLTGGVPPLLQAANQL